MTQMDELHQ